MHDGTGQMEGRRIWVRFWALLGAFVLTGSLVFLFYGLPQLSAGPAQPIAFSHRLHVTVKRIDCRYCHSAVHRSAWPGVPAVGKCIGCHSVIITAHPEIVKLRGYFDRDEPIPWRKVSWLPDHVRFHHARHIAKGVDCTACHGEIGLMDRVKAVRRFRMGFCLGCHEEREASRECLACHR